MGARVVARKKIPPLTNSDTSNHVKRSVLRGVGEVKDKLAGPWCSRYCLSKVSSDLSHTHHHHYGGSHPGRQYVCGCDIQNHSNNEQQPSIVFRRRLLDGLGLPRSTRLNSTISHLAPPRSKAHGHRSILMYLCVDISCTTLADV